MDSILFKTAMREHGKEAAPFDFENERKIR